MIGKYDKKLEEKLGDFEKGYLKALDDLIEDISTIKGEYIDNQCETSDIPTFNKIHMEITEEVYNHLIESLKYRREESQVVFIDSNHYSIDEKGNIIDDNLKK